MAKRVVNSQGVVIEIPDTASSVRLIPQEMRESELRVYSEEIRAFFKAQGIDADYTQFCYLIQPTYIMEHLLFFTRTEMSSNSKTVKLANELEQHPEILASREKTELFKSVLPDGSTGAPRWYYLCVGSITFERNLYDCKCISAEYHSPVPFAQFMRQLNEQREAQEKNTTVCYQLKTNGINLANAQELIEKAFDYDIPFEGASKVDTLFNQALKHCKDLRNFTLRDENSNKGNICFSIIEEYRRDIFPVYQEVKNFIKKTFKDVYNVRYKGSAISAQIGDNILTLYVSGAIEKPQFLVGGKMYSGIAELKKAFLSPAFFQETEWFSRTVKPHICKTASAKPQ